MAIKAAASVEGRMKMCSSASATLERVRRGSTQMMRVPFCLACFRNCGVAVPNVPSSGLQPHITISLELT